VCGSDLCLYVTAFWLIQKRKEKKSVSIKGNENESLNKQCLSLMLENCCFDIHCLLQTHGNDEKPHSSG
jgi:hypothetical protein